MADPFETVHLDGYRAELITDEAEGTTKSVVQLVIREQGEIASQRYLWSKECPTNEAPDVAAEVVRTHKLAAAMIRFLNEGGQLVELSRLHHDLQQALIGRFISIDGLPVCVESEETHVRTFRLPDGRYLRLVEDEFSEVLTVEEMVSAMNDDIKTTGGDDGLSFEL